VNAPPGSPAAPRAAPPAAYWLLPLAVAALRAIPFLATRLAAPPPGSFYPPLGYNPIDGFAYVAFIRQSATTGAWWLVNPHTTLPQDGRYFLPLLSALGWGCRLTGLDPFWALELARVPLVFAFFAVFWRVAGDFLPERRPRVLAAVLVALAGGVEFLVHATFTGWPARWQYHLLTALSDDYGWNTFAAFYNPLWVAGLTLALWALRPVLRPGAAARQPVGPGWSAAAGFAVRAVLTYLVHPYSGLGVLAIGAGVLLARARSHGERAGALRMALGLAAALGLILAFAVWQNRDAVYHATARRFFGPHALYPWWYPLGLGVPGVLAAWGAWRRWRAGTPGTRELLVWTGVAALLHSSPWTSGYHFMYLLPLPVCLLAAPALDELLRVFEDEGAPPGRQFGAALVVALAFQSAPAVTWRTTRLALARAYPAPILAAAQALAREPAAAVFTSPHVGTVLPAYTAHRMVVGHWFLTPDYAARRDWYHAVMAGRVPAAEVLAALEREAVRWVLLPPGGPAELQSALERAAEHEETFGDYRLFRLR